MRFPRLRRNRKGPGDAFVGEALADHGENISFSRGDYAAAAATPGTDGLGGQCGIEVRNHTGVVEPDALMRRVDHDVASHARSGANHAKVCPMGPSIAERLGP